MCTFCYTPYIGCPKGRRHYYLQWLKCKTAIKKGHSYCPIGKSTEVRELQKLSGNVLACPFHTHIAIQQIEFEFRQRDEIPSPIEPSEPSSPTTSNTTCVASDDESEVEVHQASQKSVYRHSSTAVYLDLRFPNSAPIQRHKSASPLKTEVTRTQRSTDGSLDVRNEPSEALDCHQTPPSNGKGRPVISPGLPASPAAYRHCRSRSQPSLQPHAKPTLKALKTERDSRRKESLNINKLSIPANYLSAPSPPPPEIITTLPTPVDQAKPPNPDLLARRLGPSTALTITIPKAPKIALQKITSSKSEPDLKSKSNGPESSQFATSASSHHTFDSFLTPSGTLQSDSHSAPTTDIIGGSSASSLLARLKDGTSTTLHHHSLSRTLSASTSTGTNRRRRQAPATTDPKNIAPWDRVHLPVSISNPVNLEVGDGRIVRGRRQEEERPRTAPLPLPAAEMEEVKMMTSRLEAVGVGVGLGIGLAVTCTSGSDEVLNSVTGHKRSCSATSRRGRMGMGFGLGLGKKRGEGC